MLFRSKYGLIFERFLNKGRKSLPDIDMDFDERYRTDVINYAIEKYGQDKVAHIVTFATIKAKQAIRDAARVLGLPFSSGDKVAKLMPPMILGNTATISECLELDEDNTSGYSKEFYSASEELRKEYGSDSEVKKAYRKMATKYHPDKVGHLGKDLISLAEEKFKAVNDAYQNIKNERGIN